MAGLFNWRMIPNKMKRPARTGNSAKVVSTTTGYMQYSVRDCYIYSIQFTVLYNTKNYLILLVFNQSVILLHIIIDTII